MWHPLLIGADLRRQRRRVQRRAALCRQDRLAIRDATARARSAFVGALATPAGLLVCFAAGFTLDRERSRDGRRMRSLGRSLLEFATLAERLSRAPPVQPGPALEARRAPRSSPRE